MQVPDTRYATRADGVSIAYQVLGEGPLDLVFCLGFISHLDLQWTNPQMTRFLRRLASFSRLIMFDKVGTGLSDPIAHVPTLEERVEDIRTVLDAVGSTRAALFGESESGPSALLFAATYPERTQAVVVYGTLVKGQPTDAELAEMGMTRGLLERREAEMLDVIDHWGEGRLVDLLMPSAAGSAMVRRSTGMFERAAVSPGMARALMKCYLSIDVTGVLAAVIAPVLIMHRRGDWIPVESSRALAARMPSARYVEFDGADHMFFTEDSDAILDETQRFLTGAVTPSEPDRMLATVLFTDIVDSTARAASLGDGAWRQLLEQHDATVRRHVEDAGGRVVKTTGDGVLAVFTGPARAIRGAQAMIGEMAELGLPIRAGLHTGECEVIGDDIAGLAVHLGARVAAKAGAGEVLVSSTVKDLVVGSGLEFADRGVHELKGVPGKWGLFAVAGQAERAPLTSAADHVTAADRMMLRLARRAPGALRAMGRLATRGS